MKRNTLFFALLFISTGLFSQNIGRHVFSVAGGEITNANLKLSWTIGQGGLAATLTNSNAILNIGFEQENDDQYVAVINYYNYEIEADVFPNPVESDAILKINSDINAEYYYRLIDTKGILIFSKDDLQLIEGSITERIPTTALKPGLYHLQLIINPNNKNAVSKTLKIIKL